jgi:hypothetical protein
MKTSTIRGFVIGAALLLGSVAGASAEGLSYGRSQAPAPLEGTWDVVITPYACTTGATFPSFRSRLMFNAGGTMVESPFNPSFQPGQRSQGLGFWERTGQSAYHAVFEAFIAFTSVVTPPTPPRYTRGVQRVEQAIEVQDNDHWTSSALVSFVDEAGNPLSSGCMPAVGVRAQ